MSESEVREQEPQTFDCVCRTIRSNSAQGGQFKITRTSDSEYWLMPIQCSERFC